MPRFSFVSGSVTVLASSTVLVLMLLSCSPGFVSASQPSGTWSTPVQISDSELVFGKICQSTIYEYGWTQLATSDDSGTSWNSAIPFYGRIEVDDYVLHRINRSDASDLVYSRSTDNGSTWSDPVLVIADAGVDGFYDIADVSGVLIVHGWTMSTSGIAVSRSLDGGATWSPAQIVDAEVYMTDPMMNDIVFVGGKLYIAYSNDTGIPPDYNVVVLIESDDLGLTWGGRREVCTGRDPLIVADGSTLYMTYWGSVGSGWGLSFIKSGDGDSWSASALLARPTHLTDPSVYQSIAVLDGRVFVAYMLYEPVGMDDYYWMHMNYSDDDGATWEDLGDVTGGDGGELLPHIMLTPTALHFTWIDNMGSGSWDGVTFYRSLTFDEPIPEFGSILLPAIGTASLVLAIALTRRR